MLFLFLTIFTTYTNFLTYTTSTEASKKLKVNDSNVKNDGTTVGTENKSQQMLSFRKKIFKHKESSAHQAAVKILKTATLKTLETACTKAFKKEKETTANVFRTAYKVVKKNQAFHDFETEIDVQGLNGVNMGCTFHPTNACINIVSHIAREMRNK